MTDVDEANAEQAEYWDRQAGPKWVALQSPLDAQLQPLGLVAIERLGAIDGASVLDVGCGCGNTSLDLARRVGASGSVLGIDLSQPMLERARQSAREAGLSNVQFRRADAQTERLAESFDAVFSRFGVMFFADPEAAFGNLRKAMKAGGALSFACWRSIDQNEWMMVPVVAALQHLPPPEMPPPGAPGPFAFADGARVEGILAAAGFAGIEVERHDRSLNVGKGQGLDEIVEFVMQMGPTGRLLQDATDDLKSRVADSITRALEPFHGDDGVVMNGSTWMVRAHNP